MPSNNTTYWWGIQAAFEYARDELGIDLTDCDLYAQSKEELGQEDED